MQTINNNEKPTTRKKEKKRNDEQKNGALIKVAKMVYHCRFVHNGPLYMGWFHARVI